MKRLFDIIFSLIGLFLLLPLFAVVAILIKLQDNGSVFFTQKRIGRNFKPFGLYKFRTMVADAPKKGLPITAGNDPRITRVGRFLRKMEIDELPQLWNVLKGDMSLVGPRPAVRKYVSKYRKDYKEILKIRPGVTDIASLTYSNEETVLKDKKDPEEYYIHILLPEKIKLAKEYVKKASLVYDLKLILLTIFKLGYPQDTILKIIKTITPYRRPIVIGIQLAVFIISNYLAFFIRFEADIPPSQFELFLRYLPLLFLLRVIFMFGFSLDRGLWRYASVRDLAGITASISLGSLLFLLSVKYLFGETVYPRSIYVVDWLLNIFLLGSIRLFRRLHEKANGKTAKKTVIVIGAGDAAEMLIRDVEHSPYYPYRIIGFIDDDPKKKGLKIRNVPILGTWKDLEKIIEREDPEEFLIAIPSASPSKLQGIVNDLRQFGLPIKTLPGLWGVLSGRDSLSKVKAVEPEDVLFRAPAYDGGIELKAFFNGKSVMITGAGGSIGSELSRQIASFSPEKLILFERHEESLYKIDMELNNSSQKSEVGSQKSKIHSVVGDILDERGVSEVMERFQPQIVFHTAAYKHVPLMEDNPHEAFKTNVIGTRMVAERAKEFGVERFVLISTDKAVNSVNVMGMTKKIGEEIVHCLSKDTIISTSQLHNFPTSTKYITVRFGNVLDSSGSVVPLFKEQIKRGGPVTVTHPDIIRYFMTIPEAVSLVLQAAAMGNGGEIFVLDMGKPVKILNLAKRMISLYGYKPGVDIDITFVGLRPGEKLYEELFNSDEIIEKTAHPKINMAISNGRVDQNILESLSNPKIFRNAADIKNILNELTQHHSK